MALGLLVPSPLLLAFDPNVHGAGPVAFVVVVPMVLLDVIMIALPQRAGSRA
jgi:hypothetical protein